MYWGAAGLLWLMVWYPFALGPSLYGVYRGWVPLRLHNALFTPAGAFHRSPLSAWTGYREYVSWWERRATLPRSGSGPDSCGRGGSGRGF